MSETMKGMFAGIVIAVGGHAFLMAPDKVTGAFLFSIGLLTVVIFNFSLCTGKMCFKQSYKEKSYIPFILYMNVIGAAVVGLADRFNMTVAPAAYKLIINKLDKSLPQLMIDSILCTLFIGIGVKGCKKTNGFAQYAIIVMSVMGFVLSGAEHIIANVYYFMASTSVSSPSSKILVFLFVNLVGNVIGGIITWGMTKE